MGDYNPDKEKRFNSSMVLPNQAKSNKVPKPIKKWARTFDILLVSETINKQVAGQIGKILSAVHKLPLVITEGEKVVDKIKELHYTCKWRMKKVPWLAQGVGIDTLTDEQLRQNINKSLNFLVSLLPKGWNNIKTVNTKFTMGRPSRIF